jgi:hypothetical protein
MANYAQTSYQEKVGNGPYPISAIGCFLTAFCNLLENFGVNVDPPTLNNFFESHGDYLSDPGDGPGVKDNLSWNSITAYNSGIVVNGQGTGWPNTNNAIVKFYYKSARTGVWETHFCKVADHNAHTILDSWDGKVKAPGEYGTPIGWASYGNARVQPVVTASNPPVAPAPQHPTTPPAGGPKELFLPSAAGTWRVYKIGGPYSSAPVDHSIHKLIPGAFPPGLTYQVLDTLAPHVFKIQTSDYGQVAIYAGPDTIAQFPAGGHGEGESQAVVTALEPAMDLVTNKDAAIYNYETGETTSMLLSGRPFHADHKAVNGDNVYFIDSAIAGGTFGIKTIDLSPAHDTQSNTETVNPSSTGEDGAEKVDVKVGSWQASFQGFMAPQRYVANKTVTVQDIDDDEKPMPSQDLLKGQTIMLAGKFIRDGIPYYRTAAGVNNNSWYGVPVTAVIKAGTDEELKQLLDDIRSLGDNAAKEEKKIVKQATRGGLISRLLKNKGV